MGASRKNTLAADTLFLPREPFKGLDSQEELSKSLLKGPQGNVIMPPTSLKQEKEDDQQRDPKGGRADGSLKDVSVVESGAAFQRTQVSLTTPICWFTAIP